MKTIVITGSTRGIGLGLAEEFLKRGHRVVISGRKQETVDEVAAGLVGQFPPEHILGVACDVTEFAQVQALWDASIARFGQVDIWINNAGVAHILRNIWDLPVSTYDSVVRVNTLGTLYGVKAAVNGMLAQGFGAVYLIEGQGADGRVVSGLGVYGLTKRAGDFLARVLEKELKGTPVISGSIQPGMVVTDLLLIERTQDPEAWERNKGIYRILADRVETVVPYLVERILENDRNGARISWLTPAKLLWRFLTARSIRRDVLQEDR